MVRNSFKCDKTTVTCAIISRTQNDISIILSQIHKIFFFFSFWGVPLLALPSRWPCIQIGCILFLYLWLLLSKINCYKPPSLKYRSFNTNLCGFVCLVNCSVSVYNLREFNTRVIKKVEKVLICVLIVFSPSPLPFFIPLQSDTFLYWHFVNHITVNLGIWKWQSLGFFLHLIEGDTLGGILNFITHFKVT